MSVSRTPCFPARFSSVRFSTRCRVSTSASRHSVKRLFSLGVSGGCKKSDREPDSPGACFPPRTTRAVLDTRSLPPMFWREPAGSGRSAAHRTSVKQRFPDVLAVVASAPACAPTVPTVWQRPSIQAQTRHDSGRTQARVRDLPDRSFSRQEEANSPFCPARIPNFGATASVAPCRKQTQVVRLGVGCLLLVRLFFAGLLNGKWARVQIFALHAPVHHTPGEDRGLEPWGKAI